MKDKLLYIDVPFFGIHGGDKNRSNFLWNILRKNFNSDLLLIQAEDRTVNQVSGHPCSGEIFELETTTSNMTKSDAIYNFSKAEIAKFGMILRENQYDVIFIRFISPGELAIIASEVSPDTKIIIDVDMLFSRIASMNWVSNKSIKNKYFYLEKLKLEKYEDKIFNHPFTFLFTNDHERNQIVERLHLEHRLIYFKILPNMMKIIEAKNIPIKEDGRYILFFGTMNSIANQDGFKYLVEEIYPNIKLMLEKANVKLLVVGKNPQPWHYEHESDYLKIVGPVDDINSYIENAAMILLPLRIASGTRTRILEAAALKKIVMTTKIGAEGFDFSKDEIVIEDDPFALSEKVIEFLKGTVDFSSYGTKIYDKCLKLYEQSVVQENLIKEISEKRKVEVTNTKGEKMKVNTGKRIAIVTNRFYPEVGGAETNIYYQARKLAENNDVTVICPKRIDKPYVEVLDGITVYRLKDVFNRGNVIPNKKARTLCPEVMGLIMFGHYDVVQVFPALNPNNKLAFLACKLSKTPIVLASFDFLDYATIIKEEGSVNPDILRFHKIKAKQKFFLKGFDYIFAISNKEIDFYKKFNKNVEYSPVPILLNEYKGKIANPRAKYNIPEDQFVYLVLGRICNVKGQDLALRAFNQVRQEVPNVKLVFVGRYDYEPEFYDEMHRYIKKNEIQDQVLFTGMIEREEVLGWLRYSNVHVIPVRFMNSGAVVVESWISDTAVIQSDVVDPNLVIEDVNGYLFTREDSKACAVKMIKAYNNKKDLPKLAAAGKKLVETKYTYKYLTDLYLRVYDKLKK